MCHDGDFFPITTKVTSQLLVVSKFLTKLLLGYYINYTNRTPTVYRPGVMYHENNFRPQFKLGWVRGPETSPPENPQSGNWRQGGWFRERRKV